MKAWKTQRKWKRFHSKKKLKNTKKAVFAEINAQSQNKRPPKTVIFQRGEYTKPMGFDGWFFKGGSTQNRKITHQSHRFCVLPPLKNHSSKIIGFVYSPLWKITHQSPSVLSTPPLEKITHQNSSVLCTPPFEKSLSLVGVYFGKDGLSEIYVTANVFVFVFGCQTIAESYDDKFFRSKVFHSDFIIFWRNYEIRCSIYVQIFQMDKNFNTQKLPFWRDDKGILCDQSEFFCSFISHLSVLLSVLLFTQFRLTDFFPRRNQLVRLCL